MRGYKFALKIDAHKRDLLQREIETKVPVAGRTTVHAILASLGTDGDVLPFIGLGVKLRARGHRVTVVVADNYADLVQAHGLEFRELVSAGTMRELIGNADFWHPIKTARFTSRWAASQIEPHYRVLSEFASDAESVFVTNPGVLPAIMVSEKFARPHATIVLQPWMIPSRVAPPIMPIPGMPSRAPRFVHALFLDLMGVAADFLTGRDVNRVRRSVGLKPMRRILQNWLSKQLVIGMFPDWFGPAQEDWPKQVRLSGFPLFDAATKRALPVGLPEFLGSGKQTVVFTFGSGMMHARQLVDAATRVCEALKIQGLIVNRHMTPNLPAHMFHAAFVPFKDLFPRCAAIVHHGGVGTMAEAIAAGRPQLILPLGFDQIDNGVRIQKLGIGLHTRSKHALVARTKSLRERDIREVTELVGRLLEPSFQDRARAFAARVRDVDGLDRAANLLEEFARNNAVRFAAHA